MARRVFFSFHYERDIWRASQVRNHWVTKPDGETAGYVDAAQWEQIKKRGENAVYQWIDEQLRETSVTVVLIGYETSTRKFVNYEIKKSCEQGKGMFGVYIHKLRDRYARTDPKGKNPFENFTIDRNGKKVSMSEIYPMYDWVDDDGYNNLPLWVEQAAHQPTMDYDISLNSNAPIQGVEESENYRFDIFLSYTHQPIFTEWIFEVFLTLFKWYLAEALTRLPVIYSSGQEDKQWFSANINALAYSKCLVAFWSPSYFRSSQCLKESYAMIQREEQENYQTPENPQRLIYPVTIHGSKVFPEFAKRIKQFDCSSFVVLGSAFKETRRYVDFQDSLKEFVEEVAYGITSAPAWKESWLQIPIIEPPKLDMPELKLPFLE